MTILFDMNNHPRQTFFELFRPAIKRKCEQRKAFASRNISTKQQLRPVIIAEKKRCNAKNIQSSRENPKFQKRNSGFPNPE
jgi:hypothetical protein